MIENHILPIPPGETIKELLDIRNMTQKEFAIRMDLSEKHVYKLIKGEVLLTQDVSIRLEYVLGVPAHVWNGLEASYREKLLRIENEKYFDEDLAVLDRIPYSYLEEQKWIEKSENNIQRVNNLRKFFEVTKLSLLFSLDQSLLFKGLHSTVNQPDIMILALLQKAKLMAREIDTNKLSIRSLKKTFTYIVSKSPNSSCGNLLSDIKDLLNQCGIKLIILPAIKEYKEFSFIYQDSKDTLVCITDDTLNTKLFYKILFSNFAHILLGHLKESSVFSKAMCSDAQDMANNLIIKKQEYDAFVDVQNISEDTITKFAKEKDISNGIVVGMLEDSGYIQKAQFDYLVEIVQ